MNNIKIYREKIENFAKEVFNKLGMGYSEKIYHEALLVEFRLHGWNNYQSETIIPVEYKGYNIGNVRSDIILNKIMVIELKAVTGTPTEVEKQQLRNYLYLKNMNHGMIINFPQPGVSKSWCPREGPDFFHINLS
jgi:GxxExxY protein